MRMQRMDWLKLVPALMAAFLFVGCGAPEEGAPEGGGEGGVTAPGDMGGETGGMGEMPGGEGESAAPAPAGGGETEETGAGDGS